MTPWGTASPSLLHTVLPKVYQQLNPFNHVRIVRACVLDAIFMLFAVLMPRGKSHKTMHRLRYESPCSQIADRGIRALVKVLENNNVVTFLNLQDNQV